MSNLTVRNISKQFPGTLALDDVSITFESGRVNALVGKNGSGKSTLVKIINGAEIKTEGSIFLEGEELNFTSPKDAQTQGIATVYQELSLVPGLTVAENILMGRFVMKGRRIDWKKNFETAGKILHDMGISIDPRQTVAELSMWQCQMIEIAKAMSSNPRVLLLDEPTSSLAQSETEMLFGLIRELKKKDVIIIYITHRLQELWEICDICDVLRDGMWTGRLDMRTAAHKELLDLMFGDTEVKVMPEDLAHSDEVIFEAKSLTQTGNFTDVSFKLRRGEVLGIAGMLGSGRTELLRALFGVTTLDGGELFIENTRVEKFSPVHLKKKGIGLTPEDRKYEGLVQVASIKRNLCNASLELLSIGMRIDSKKEQQFAQRQVDGLDIKVSSIELPVTSLSGGNQQKVVVGNWLNTSPRIMLFDEPSRGIDVKAKQQIFEIIWELSRSGVASIVVSTELEELLEICHRVLIMIGGRITGEVKPSEIKIDDLYSLCMGVNG